MACHRALGVMPFAAAAPLGFLSLIVPPVYLLVLATGAIFPFEVRCLCCAVLVPSRPWDQDVLPGALL